MDTRSLQSVYFSLAARLKLTPVCSRKQIVRLSPLPSSMNMNSQDENFIIDQQLSSFGEDISTPSKTWLTQLQNNCLNKLVN